MIAVCRRMDKSPFDKIKIALKLLGGGLLLLPALGLLAFGPRTGRQTPSDRVVVTYWEKWTDFEGEAMRNLVAYYNDTAGAEAGIYVDYVTTSQIDFKTKIAIAGGDPPDLVGLWLYNVSSFASKGALQALDDRASQAGINDELIIPAMYQACRYHENLYALPLTPWTIALYYNEDLFAEFADELRKAGLDPDRPPRTLDELSAYARVIHRRGPDGEIELLAFLPGTPETVGWCWDSWALWFGGSYVDETTGEMRVDTEPYLRGYGWVQDYARQFGIRDVLRFESGLANFNSPDNPFMIRKLAMLQQGPFFANMIHQYAPDINYGVAPFPTHDGSEVGLIRLDVLAVPTGARHTDEAWAFMDWLYTSEPIVVPSRTGEPEVGYEYYMATTESGPQRRPMPPMRPVEWLCWAHFKNGTLLDPTPAFLTSHRNPAIDVHERMARRPSTHAAPPLPNWKELRIEFVAAYRDIWAGSHEADSRLKECQDRIDALVVQAKRQMRRHGAEYP